MECPSAGGSIKEEKIAEGEVLERKVLGKKIGYGKEAFDFEFC